MLLGFSLSSVQPRRSQHATPLPIAAFGDSLTAGSGASSVSHAYPARASALFSPPRDVIDRGVGGQTSTQIAARQGGIPLRLAVLGEPVKNLFPGTRDWQTTFETGTINGLTHQLVQTGLDGDGLPYGDIRIYGMATATFTDVGRQIYGAIAANYEVDLGTNWTISGEVQRVAGSANGVVGFSLLLIQADELGGYLNEIAAPSLPLDGTRNRISASGTATHAFIRSTFVLNVTSGSAVDITLRIFPGQLEAGESATALQLTPSDSSIPAYQPAFSISSDFSSNTDGWAARLQDGHLNPVWAESGKLVVRNDDTGLLRGCERALPDIPGGKIIHLAFDLQFLSGEGLVHIGGLRTPGGSWATTNTDGNPTWVVDRNGHFELVFESGNATFGNDACGAVAFVTSGSDVTFSLDNIIIEWGDENPQIPVTYRSIDILSDSGAHVGKANGVLAGIRGTISTDATGRWSFTRHAAGNGAPVPYGTEFILDDATSLRHSVQWIWAGRNNAGEKATVMADIATMTAYVAGDRYLVGSILPAATDTPEVLEAIAELNTLLAATYASRYVDLHAALTAAGNGTIGDQQDAAAGLVPRSLRSDAIHLNDEGYAVVAAAWTSATLAMGW